MIFAFIAVLLIWCSSLFWTLRSVNVTSDQLTSLLDTIWKIPDPVDRIRLLKQLDVDSTYVPHLVRVLTFRDPWSIYPAELANLMRVAA